MMFIKVALEAFLSPKDLMLKAPNSKGADRCRSEKNRPKLHTRRILRVTRRSPSDRENESLPKIWHRIAKERRWLWPKLRGMFCSLCWVKYYTYKIMHYSGWTKVTFKVCSKVFQVCIVRAWFIHEASVSQPLLGLRYFTLDTTKFHKKWMQRLVMKFLPSLLIASIHFLQRSSFPSGYRLPTSATHACGFWSYDTHKEGKWLLSTAVSCSRRFNKK